MVQNTTACHLADDGGGLLPAEGDLAARGVLGDDGVEVAAVGVVGARGGVHARREERGLHGSGGGRRGQCDEGEGEGKLEKEMFGNWFVCISAFDGFLNQNCPHHLSWPVVSELGESGSRYVDTELRMADSLCRVLYPHCNPAEGRGPIRCTNRHPPLSWRGMETATARCMPPFVALLQST